MWRLAGLRSALPSNVTATHTGTTFISLPLINHCWLLEEKQPFKLCYYAGGRGRLDAICTDDLSHSHAPQQHLLCGHQVDLPVLIVLELIPEAKTCVTADHWYTKNSGWHFCMRKHWVTGGGLHFDFSYRATTLCPCENWRKRQRVSTFCLFLQFSFPCLFCYVHMMTTDQVCQWL